MRNAREKILKELKIMLAILFLISIPAFIYWHLPFFAGLIMGFLLCLCLLAIEKIQNGY